ncbi:MAG: hypothetical protein MRK02_16220 [Candidatus Scalindua sp.]|nr:hypothetical protein [Candidatus Scalindua sp.]
MEVTKVLPPGEEQDLDSKELAKLIRKAIYRTLADLKKLSLPQKTCTVYRPDESSLGCYDIKSPSYREDVIWLRINKIWRSEESITLTDYIWKRGALKLTLTGQNPDKDVWAFNTYHKLVREPLLVALESTTRERLVDYGAFEEWAVDEEKIEEAIRDAVNLYGKHRRFVTAFCPLSSLSLLPGTCLEIAPDIKLKRWTPRNLSVFLSRHSHEFLWDDFKAPYCIEAIAEVSFSFKARKKVQQNSVTSMVQDLLDLLKWVLFVSLNQERPVAEGTCLIKCELDVRMGRFRRDENIGPSDCSLDKQTVNRCTELLQDFRSAAKQVPDLNKSLWHFGRSCVATLPRDIQLESAI